MDTPIEPMGDSETETPKTSRKNPRKEAIALVLAELGKVPDGHIFQRILAKALSVEDML